MAELQVGKVTHYFDKIGVAVVLIEESSLNEGDTIKIVDHENEFTQQVTSMQVNHQAVQTANKGDEVGMKVDQPVKDGALVFKISA